MDIRTDIYPVPENKVYLDALAKRTQEAFPKVFPTVDNVIAYVNNFKSPKLAGLFLDVGNYYNNTLEMPPFTELILALSVMEKMASVETSGVEGWVDFYDWVDRKDVDEEYSAVLRKGKFRDFSALMDSLKGRWNKQYANITKVTNFLRTALSVEEKQALIGTIRYVQVVPELPLQAFANLEDFKSYIKNNPAKTVEAALPACFEAKEYWKCITAAANGKGICYCQGKVNCPIAVDKEKLDKCLKDTIKTVYDWRSKYLHDLQLPPVKETILYGVQYKGKIVKADLAITDFRQVFEGVVKRFFDNYQVTAVKKKAKQ